MGTNTLGDTMKPEQLKVIAEGMGYKCGAGAINKREVIFIWTTDTGEEYNPLTNNDQMVEIMEKLKLDVSYEPSGHWTANGQLPTDAFYEGKTINEAVCNAAYEYFKD